MMLEFFDVGHGACALLTGDNGVRIMIDCGHHSTRPWFPGLELKQRNVGVLDHLYITNYDEDHVSGLPNLLQSVQVSRIWRNTSVSPNSIEHLKTKDGMGQGIRSLVDTLTNTHTMSGEGAYQSMPTGVSAEFFYNFYPSDFDDENNLSMVVFLKCFDKRIMFTGDMEIAGFAKLLRNATFRQRLTEANIYVAPHHGRESGCCPDVKKYLTNVECVIVSDKAVQYETQKTMNYYWDVARGIQVGGKTHYVLTTRSLGNITLLRSFLGWSLRTSR